MTLALKILVADGCVAREHAEPLQALLPRAGGVDKARAGASDRSVVADVNA